MEVARKPLIVSLLSPILCRLKNSLELLRAEAERLQQSAAQRSTPSGQAPSEETSQAKAGAEEKARELEAAAEREHRLQETVAQLKAANVELEGALKQERERLNGLQSDHELAVSGRRGLETEKRDLACSLQVSILQRLFLGSQH